MKFTSHKTSLQLTAGSKSNIVLKIAATLETTAYRLCGPVVRVSGYRSRGPGSIPGANRISEK
jgi:hypothetical protein